MNVGTGPILVIDGDETRTAALRALLLGQRCSVHSVTSAAEALARLDERPFDAVVTRLSMPDMPCAALISTILASWPETSVVVVAADASVPEAVEAVKAGATDFLLEPIDREQLSFVLGKAMTATSRAIEPAPRCDAALLGDSLLMQDVLALLGRAAAGTATVLVRGESGTGKELAARALHGLSARRAEAFVKIDCTSLPEALLESELFGYEKGAFTGATARKLGRIELAQGGTLFLDEIGELTGPLQAKLLRLLQDREFERLGGTKTLRVDVRVVAATHRDLETMVERGQFRQDLYYRLNVIAVWLPPLRARRDDIAGLARHFFETFAAANRKSEVSLHDSALSALRGQRWPGNVRQLQNLIERLVVMSDSRTIGEADVRAELGRQVRFVTQPGSISGTLAPRSLLEAVAPEQSVVGPLQAELQRAEKKAIERALRHASGNRSLAARLLGVSRTTLYAKLEEHGLI